MAGEILPTFFTIVSEKMKYLFNAHPHTIQSADCQDPKET